MDLVAPDARGPALAVDALHPARAEGEQIAVGALHQLGHPRLDRAVAAPLEAIGGGAVVPEHLAAVGQDRRPAVRQGQHIPRPRLQRDLRAAEDAGDGRAVDHAGGDHAVVVPALQRVHRVQPVPPRLALARVEVALDDEAVGLQSPRRAARPDLGLGVPGLGVQRGAADGLGAAHVDREELCVVAAVDHRASPVRVQRDEGGQQQVGRALRERAREGRQGLGRRGRLGRRGVLAGDAHPGDEQRAGGHAWLRGGGHRGTAVARRGPGRPAARGRSCRPCSRCRTPRWPRSWSGDIRRR